jgi:hypothetical protein
MERVWVSKVVGVDGATDAIWLRVEDTGGDGLRLVVVDKAAARSWTAEVCVVCVLFTNDVYEGVSLSNTIFTARQIAF